MSPGHKKRWPNSSVLFVVADWLTTAMIAMHRRSLLNGVLIETELILVRVTAHTMHQIWALAGKQSPTPAKANRPAIWLTARQRIFIISAGCCYKTEIKALIPRPIISIMAIQHRYFHTVSLFRPTFSEISERVYFNRCSREKWKYFLTFFVVASMSLMYKFCSWRIPATNILFAIMPTVLDIYIIELFYFRILLCKQNYRKHTMIE